MIEASCEWVRQRLAHREHRVVELLANCVRSFGKYTCIDVRVAWLTYESDPLLVGSSFGASFESVPVGGYSPDQIVVRRHTRPDRVFDDAGKPGRHETRMPELRRLEMHE